MELTKSFGYLKKLHDAEWAIENSQKPTLAAINGLCLGEGSSWPWVHPALRQ